MAITYEDLAPRRARALCPSTTENTAGRDVGLHAANFAQVREHAICPQASLVSDRRAEFEITISRAEHGPQARSGHTILHLLAIALRGSDEENRLRSFALT
jgi:hypothetical protein